MNSKLRASEKAFHKYEYLAQKYASKIYSYEELSFEFEDLLQEFRIKIFTSIKAYGKRMLRFRRGEDTKPVPLRYYLEAACSNKYRDFIKYISRENHKVRIDDINFDFGVDQENDIDPSRNRFIVRGVNLLEGLTGKERAVFSLFLRGYNMNFLNKVYFSNAQEKTAKKSVINSDDEPFTPADIIEMQKQKIISKYGNELRSSKRVYQTYDFED